MKTVLALLLLLSGCAQRQARVRPPELADPFNQLLGTGINNVLAKMPAPVRVTDGTDGVTIYSWVWNIDNTVTSVNPGTRVNIGSRARPNYQVWGGGARSTTTTTSYYLNFSVRDGQIIQFAHNLPKDALKQIARSAK